MVDTLEEVIIRPLNRTYRVTLVNGKGTCIAEVDPNDHKVVKRRWSRRCLSTRSILERYISDVEKSASHRATTEQPENWRTYRFRPNVGTVMSVEIRASNEDEARRGMAFILERTTEWYLVSET